MNPNNNLDQGSPAIEKETTTSSQPAEAINIVQTKRRPFGLIIFSIIAFIILASIVGVSVLSKKFELKRKSDVTTPTLIQETGEKPAAPDKLSGVSASFTAPYPVVWEDVNNTPNFGGSAKFSLTSAYIGKYQITEDVQKTLWDGFSYQGYSAGQEINAVVLGFKINIGKGYSLPSSIRRITIDEAGNEDKHAKINRDYLYDGHKPMNDEVQSDSTIENAKVIFAVPENESKFLFSTGGLDDKRFELLINNGQIEVRKPDAQCQNEWKSKIPEGAENVLDSLITALRNGDVPTAVSLIENSKEIGLEKNISDASAEDLNNLADSIECSQVVGTKADRISFSWTSKDDQTLPEGENFSLTLKNDQWYFNLNY
jgi:hypothetical protein